MFKYPAVFARHQEGPLARERESYLSYKISEGFSFATCQRFARELLVIAREFAPKFKFDIGLKEIEETGERWAHSQKRRHRAKKLKWSRELFISVAIDWFRFLGRFQECEITKTPFSELTDDFANYMHNERGLSTTTIRNRIWHGTQFLSWFSTQKRPFSEVSVGDIDAFLALNSKRWTRVSVVTSVKALRAFFVYAERRHWCSQGIADAIESPRVFSQENLPIGVSWKDVQRLIADTESDQPRDIRDRAILMFFAIYGLRSGEVSGLRLDDCNWENETITIHRSKIRRSHEYPITPIVGTAIIRYLKNVRPRCNYREIFLTLKAPFCPISSGGLYNLVSNRLSKLGIVATHRGPHVLRHACASHLLSEGASLKEIGDLLGHRNLDVTRIYAKVDIAGLREVADFDLGGVL